MDVKGKELLRPYSSGVARVSCGLGKKYSCVPCQQNLLSLKWKIEQKFGRSNNCSFLRVIKRILVLEMNCDKVIIAGGSNNAGVWERSPRR